MTPETLQFNAEEETLVIVLADSALIGCGYLKETVDSIYLGKLAVQAAYRKRGVLTKIVNIAVDVARRQSKPCLSLETRIELTENHRTFEALGFVKTAENSHFGYNRPTRITMTRRL